MLSSVTKGSKLPRRTEKDSARLKEVVTRSSKGAGPAHRPNLKTSVVDRRDELHYGTTPRHPTSRGADPKRRQGGNLTFGTPRTPAVARKARPLPAKQGPVTTPHTIRALQQRRNGHRVPGHDQRRSGRLHRETPRDTLRNLSRILAPISRRHSSPGGADSLAEISGKSRRDESEDELDPTPPRLSINVTEPEEEDSFNEPPPRLSMLLDDDGVTQRSIEASRKAHNQQLHARLSKGSLGSMRLSDRFADVDELQSSDGPVQNGSPTLNRNSLVRSGLNIDSDLGDFAVQHDDESSPSGPTISSKRPLLGNEDTTFAFHIPVIQEPIPSLPAKSDEEDNDVVASQLKERKGRGNITSEYSRKFSVRKRNPKTQKMSRLGIPYPSIPEGVVKRFATLHTNRVVAKKTRLKKETLKAVMQASEWFLEQVGDDLGAFARHAGRKTIDESDVTTLMRRQRQIDASTTTFSLAHKHLPRELLQALRMPRKLSSNRKRKRTAGSDGDNNDTQDGQPVMVTVAPRNA